MLNDQAFVLWKPQNRDNFLMTSEEALSLSTIHRTQTK